MLTPAGMFYSSVSDYTNWLRMWLNEGKLGEESVLQSNTVQAAFTPRVSIPQPIYPAAKEAGVDLVCYGLGWFLHNYRGRRVNMHTGSLDGMSAIVGLMPEEELGVVVFINADHIELRHALMYEVFDRALGGEQSDWSGELRSLYESIEEKGKAARAEQLAELGDEDESAIPLKEYSGLYRHPIFGDAAVTTRGQTLVLKLPPLLSYELKPRGANRFVARRLRLGFENEPEDRRYRGGDPGVIRFELGSDNRPTKITSLGGAEFKRVSAGN